MPADLPAKRRECNNSHNSATTPRLLPNGKNSARAFSSTWRKTCNSNTDCIAGVTAFFTGRRTIHQNRERFAQATDAKPNAPKCDERIASGADPQSHPRSRLSRRARPEDGQRTWQEVMDEMATHGIPTTQERCARGFRSKAYDPIRNKPLVQTTGADLLAIIHANGNCVAHYLRRLHNLAVDLGWLAWPILAKRAWPKIRSQSKRAITAEEHAAVIASEKNAERRAYYELLYETGAAQTDAANLTAENIDWQNGVLVYRRKKLGPFSEPCRLTIGKKLRTLLQVSSALGRFVSKHQTNFCESSLRRISPTLPCCRNCRCQLAFVPPRLGAACEGLRISTAIRARSARPRQPRCA